MKPFFLLLLLIVSGILFDILSRPVGHLAVLCQRLQFVPARLSGKRRNTLPTAGPTGSFGRSHAGEAWRPAAQF